MARVDLGLTQAQTRRLSPGKLEALLRRLHTRERALAKAANLRAGVIAAALANTFGANVEPGDFFRETDEPDQHMTGDETLAFLKGHFGGAPEEPHGHP